MLEAVVAWGAEGRPELRSMAGRKKSLDPKERYRRPLRRGRALAAAARNDAALAAFRRALAAAEALAEAEPEDRLLQRDLARLHQAMGQTYRQTGALDEALAAQRACHAIAARLAALDPDVAQRQYNVSLAHADLRDTLATKGEPRLAIAAARLAATVADQVAERFGQDDPLWVREAIRQRLAVARLLRNDPAQADERARQLDLACRHGERLLRAEPDASVWQATRSALLDLADICRRLRRYDEALGVLERYRLVAQREFARAPDDSSSLTNFALAYYLTGLVHEMAGDGKGALAAFDEGLGLFEALPADAYLTEDVQTQRGRFLAQAAAIAAHHRDAAGARRIETIMLARLLTLSEAAPQDTERQQRVMSVTDDLVRVLLGIGQAGPALVAARFARNILEARAVGEDDVRTVHRWRAFLLAEEGRALRMLGRREEAGAAFVAGIALNERLVQDDPSDLRAQCDIAFAHWQWSLAEPGRRAHCLSRARAILRFLDRTGRLPPYARPWIADIERELRVA